MISHTHIRTHTHSAHTHTLSHALTHTHPPSHSHIRSFLARLLCGRLMDCNDHTHTHTHAHALSFSHTHTHTLAHSPTPTHTLSHTHAHTLTHQELSGAAPWQSDHGPQRNIMRAYCARPEINGVYDRRRGACVCVCLLSTSRSWKYRACLLCTSRN